jgi:hypothetical protein
LNGLKCSSCACLTGDRSSASGQQPLVHECANCKSSLTDTKCSLNDSKCSLNDTRCCLYDSKCSPNYTKCSLKDTKCSLKDTKCSLNDSKCSLNDTKCSLKGTKCSFNDTNWSRNESLNEAKCSLQVMEVVLVGSSHCCTSALTAKSRCLRPRFHVHSSHRRYGSNILSPWLPIGHTFGIFPVPGFLLVTLSECSQSLASYWSHVRKILSPWLPIGRTFGLYECANCKTPLPASSFPPAQLTQKVG